MNPGWLGWTMYAVLGGAVVAWFIWVMVKGTRGDKEEDGK